MPRSPAWKTWPSFALLLLAACASEPEMTAAERDAKNLQLTERQMRLLSETETSITARYGAPRDTTAIDRGEKIIRYGHPDCDLLLTVAPTGEIIETSFDATPGDTGLLACAHWL